MLHGCLLALTGEGEPAIQKITAGLSASRLNGTNVLRMPWYLSCLAEAHAALSDTKGLAALPGGCRAHEGGVRGKLVAIENAAKT